MSATFQDAEDFCVAWDGHLLWLDGLLEYNYIRSTITQPQGVDDDDVWIGLTRSSATATWRWTYDPAVDPAYTPPVSADQSALCCRLKDGDCLDNFCSAAYPYFICKREFFCYSKQPSDSSVCSSHGTCVGVDQCECDDGWDGTQCNLAVCFGLSAMDSNSCSGHGFCTGVNYCTCESGWDGDECEFPLCGGVVANSTAVCTGHGDCIAPNVCSCESGYGGSDCEVAECYGKWANESTVCSGRGSCNTADNCSCDSGYGGDECEWNICYSILGNDTNVCSTHGNCSSPDHCDCFSGYTGSECQLNICYNVLSNETSVCSTHGACSAPDFCDCTTGYGGLECELNVCHSILSNETSVCSSHGNCTSPNTCECETYYGGEDCELFFCFDTLSNESSVCSGRGACTDVDNCLCDAGYGGENCELFYCFNFLSNESSVCTGRGSCLGPDDCSCHDSRYTGPNCIYPQCFGLFSNDSLSCSSHGTCVDYQFCLCDEGFRGTDCQREIIQEYECQSVVSDEKSCFHFQYVDHRVCSSHGSCIAWNHCECSEGFFGDRCQFDLSVLNRDQRLYFNGTAEALWLERGNTPQDGFNIDESALATDDCGNLFISSPHSHSIQKRSRFGDINVMYGSSKLENGLTDGKGLLARFDTPVDLAFNSFGHLMVADRGNGLVRYVNTFSGQVFTYAIREQNLSSEPMFSNLNCIVVGEWNDAFVCNGHGIGRLPFLSSRASTFFDTATTSFSLEQLAPFNMSGYREAQLEDAASFPPLFRNVTDLEFQHLHSYLFIVDSGNHVIRVCKRRASAMHGHECITSLVAGVPQVAGYRDGSVKEALFSSPRFIVQAKYNDMLYVSDIGNQAIRAINLKSKTVRTVAGGILSDHTSLQFSFDHAHLSSLTFSKLGRVVVQGTDLLVSDVQFIWKLKDALLVHDRWFSLHHYSELPDEGSSYHCFGFSPSSENVCSGRGICQKNVSDGLTTTSGYCICEQGYSGPQCELNRGYSQCDNSHFQFLNDGSKGDEAHNAREMRRMHVDENGNVIAADFFSHTVKHFQPRPGSNYHASIYAGSGRLSDTPQLGNSVAANVTSFRHPLSVARAGNLLFVSDTENRALKAVNVRRNDRVQRYPPIYYAPVFRNLSPDDSTLYGEDFKFVELFGSWVIPDTNGLKLFNGSNQGSVCSESVDQINWIQNQSRFDTLMDVAYDSHNRVFYVTDSGYHIVQKVSFGYNDSSTFPCNVSHVAGTLAEPGFRDGHLNWAQFNHPHGILYYNGFLMIADTFNGAIRKIDLKRYRVTSLFGACNSQINGQCQRTAPGSEYRTGDFYLGAPIANLRFSRPYDIHLVNSKLFVSDTGLNRIVEVDFQMHDNCSCTEWNAFTEDCACAPGFIGDRCETKNRKCFGFALQDRDSCFLGNDAGSCYFANNCKCSEQRMGAQCEFNTCVMKSLEQLTLPGDNIRQVMEFEDDSLLVLLQRVDMGGNIIMKVSNVSSSEPKVESLLGANNTMLLCTNSSRECSESQSSSLQFCSVKKIDVHVANNGSTVFLLNNTFVYRWNSNASIVNNISMESIPLDISASQNDPHSLYVLKNAQTLLKCDFLTEKCHRILKADGDVDIASVLVQNSALMEDEIFLLSRNGSGIYLFNETSGNVALLTANSSTVSQSMLRDGNMESYATFSNITVLARGVSFPITNQSNMLLPRLFFLDRNHLRVLFHNSKQVITLHKFPPQYMGSSLARVPSLDFFHFYCGSESSPNVYHLDVFKNGSCHCMQGTWNPFVSQCSCEHAALNGTLCNQYLASTCFGRTVLDPLVCSGHGYCIENNICSCHNESQWTSFNCHIPVCFGIPANETETCSGKGTCSSPDTCECVNGFSPPLCEPCGEGRYWTTDGCKRCPKGTASSTLIALNNSTCEQCPNNYFSDSEGLASCIACPDMTHHVTELIGEVDDSNCQMCPHGTFVQRGKDCIPCPVGTYLDRTGVQMSDCIPCPQGTFSNKVGISDITMCEPCARGEYSNRTGVDHCFLCPPGFMSSNRTGSSSVDQACIPCSPGTGSSSEKSTQCILCRAGQYSKALSNGGRECSPCELGFYQPQFNQTECIACPYLLSTVNIGSNNIQDCLLCGSGYYLKGKTCVPCPLGTAHSMENATSIDDCLTCPDGYYADDLGSSTCSKCLKGAYTPNKFACFPCSPGTYSNEDGSPSCIDCALGSWSPEAATTCEPCPVGSFGNASIPQASSDHCTHCPDGFISPLLGGVNCTQCPAGHYANELQSECLPCPAGSVGLTPGLSSSDQCTFCPAGFWSNSTGTALSLEDACQPCKPGFWSNTLGSNSVDNCLPCPLGTYQPKWGAATISRCMLCPRGYKCSMSGCATPIPCKVAENCPVGSSVERPTDIPSSLFFPEDLLTKSANFMILPVIRNPTELWWNITRYVPILIIVFVIFTVLALLIMIALCIYGKRNPFAFVKSMDMLFSLRRQLQLNEALYKKKTYFGGAMTIFTMGTAAILCSFTLSDFLFANIDAHETFLLQPSDTTFSASSPFRATVHFFGAIENCSLTHDDYGTLFNSNGYEGSLKQDCSPMDSYHGLALPSCRCTFECSNCSVVNTKQHVTFTLNSFALTNLIAYEFSSPFYVKDEYYTLNGTIAAQNGTAFYSDSSIALYMDLYRVVYFGLDSFFIRLLGYMLPFSFSDQTELTRYGYQSLLSSTSKTTAEVSELGNANTRTSLRFETNLTPFYLVVQEREKKTPLEVAYECFGLVSVVISVMTLVMYGLYILDEKLQEKLYEIRSARRASTRPVWVSKSDYNEELWIEGGQRNGLRESPSNPDDGNGSKKIRKHQKQEIEPEFLKGTPKV